MESGERIVRYTAEELRETREAGLSQTNWARVDAMTEEELGASIDHDEEGEFDWTNVMTEIPKPKQQLTIWLDTDIIEWIKALGAGYQTRMNAVLRSYMEEQGQDASRDR